MMGVESLKSALFIARVISRRVCGSEKARMRNCVTYDCLQIVETKRTRKDDHAPLFLSSS